MSFNGNRETSSALTPYYSLGYLRFYALRVITLREGRIPALRVTPAETSLTETNKPKTKEGCQSTSSLLPNLHKQNANCISLVFYMYWFLLCGWNILIAYRTLLDPIELCCPGENRHP